MSEEYGLKFVVNGEDYDKIKKSLNKQIEDLQQKLKSISKRIRKAIDNDEDDLLYVLFDIQDIIQDEEEQKLAYDRYIKPYIE